MSFLVNASNLHVGGGVQVAVSFISELYFQKQFNFSIVCSTIVRENLPQDLDTDKFVSFKVIDVFGLSKLDRTKKEYFEGFDVCFTIFGPFYPRIDAKYHICGFAQPWIAYPNNDVYSKLSFFELLKNKLRFSVQNILFKSYDRLVVEGEHVKASLISRGYNDSDISVVSNCVSTIYDDESKWADIDFDYSQLEYDFTLGFIGRPYPHKNIEILHKVNEILKIDFGLKINFLFTFSGSEMKKLGFDKLKNFHTVGVINTNQCPNFYKSIDALIFPSLLECFSASPIEALKTSTTVIASNYPFVRDVCKDAAFYFDPLNPNDIAKVINEVCIENNVRESKKLLGKKIVDVLPTAEDRAASYADIIFKTYNEIGK
ncbi:glycosyltransferase family 4 protein [Vibrio mytili]|uniref:glycosyltransferase family 4 protein n=1 Tax=Vibrio mytili TaxID=50718 RepID=UPI002F40AFF2